MPTNDAQQSVKEVQIPEWEHVVGKEAGQNAIEHKRNRWSYKDAAATKLNAMLPAHRRYLGMKRRTFLLALLALILAVLALIIGLAAGLSNASSDKDLPLPSNTASFTGDLTYYEPGLGACGVTSTSSDNVVSVSEILFDSAGSTSSNGGNSNNNPLCNKMIRAQRYNADAGETRSVDLKVVDRCTGCAVDDLDTTESVFEKLAPIASGRVDITWAWLQPVPTAS